MKIVIQEWFKCKKACGMLLTYLVSEIIYIIINAYLVRVIAGAISDIPNLSEYLIEIGVICVIQIVISAIAINMKKSSHMILYSELNNRYGDKMLDSDADMFTKFTCARISTTGEFIDNVSKMGTSTVDFILQGIRVIATLFSMYVVGGSLVVPVIIIYVVGAFVMKLIYVRLSRWSEDFKDAKKARNQEMENIVYGFREVRSYNTEKYHRDRIHAFNRECQNAGLSKAKVLSGFNGVVDTIDTGGLFAVILYVGDRLMTGIMDQAAAMSLVMYVFRLVEPLIRIMDYLDEMSGNLSLAKDYVRVINYENENDNDGPENFDTVFAEENKSVIQFKHVGFNYKNKSSCLKDVSFSIPAGKRIGICGPSGGGKSTIFKLLTKNYVPKKGKITIDGSDINKLSNDSYRRLIACVHQENMIFPGSIRDNITYGYNGAHGRLTDNIIFDVCKQANIFDFINSLDKKLDTILGPMGIDISGGERQRIALARALLNDKPILLLDEATSALDRESESAIQMAVDNLENKTVVSIAHRLETIMNCDQILVVANGGIAERGTHEELLSKRGIYYRMWNVGKDKYPIK